MHPTETRHHSPAVYPLSSPPENNERKKSYFVLYTSDEQIVLAASKEYNRLTESLGIQHSSGVKTEPHNRDFFYNLFNFKMNIFEAFIYKQMVGSLKWKTCFQNHCNFVKLGIF